MGEVKRNYKMFANPVFITPGRSIFKRMFLLIFSYKTAKVSRQFEAKKYIFQIQIQIQN